MQARPIPFSGIGARGIARLPPLYFRQDYSALVCKIPVTMQSPAAPQNVRFAFDLIGGPI
jgi:hypothetical protein